LRPILGLSETPFWEGFLHSALYRVSPTCTHFEEMAKNADILRELEAEMKAFQKIEAGASFAQCLKFGVS
jgi:hypothetical protein